MNSDYAFKSLAGGRIAVGVSAWLAPGLFGRALRLDLAGNRQAGYLSRLFGARDAALGIGALSTRGEARRAWLLAAVACDAADAAAAILGGRAGYLPKSTAVLLGAPAVAATAIGAIALAGAPPAPAAG